MPKQCDSQTFAGRDWEKPRKPLVSIADFSAEIRNENLPNIRLKVLPYSWQLDVSEDVTQNDTKCVDTVVYISESLVLMH
jgi:hypothetical protein